MKENRKVGLLDWKDWTSHSQENCMQGRVWNWIGLELHCENKTSLRWKEAFYSVHPDLFSCDIIVLQYILIWWLATKVGARVLRGRR